VLGQRGLLPSHERTGRLDDPPHRRHATTCAIFVSRNLCRMDSSISRVKRSRSSGKPTWPAGDRERLPL